MGWVGLALVVACLLAGLLLWLVARRRRELKRDVRRAARRHAPRYPVVLVHGVLGFDEIALGSARHAYFRGIDDMAETLGVVLHRPRLPALSAVPRRAAELERFLAKLDAPRVNIIAHSMGGLDARYALAHLGLSRRVASLVTIGTPHHGTPLADVGTRLLSEKLRRLAALLGLDLDAFDDLTCARMQPFNAEILDQRRVFYGSVVGAVESPLRITPVLLPFHRFILKRAGPNDGLVPSSSQAWGDLLFEVEADHWAQIGWSRHFDTADMFAELFRELRGRGL